MGRVGSDCAGEEIAVHLIWSTLSGKTKVIWNDRDITQIFPKTALKNCMRRSVDLKWKIRSGQTFEIIARSDSQYDFSIDGCSFSTLPTVSQLGTKEYALTMKQTHSYMKECRLTGNLGDDTDAMQDHPVKKFPKRLIYSKLSSFGSKGKNLDNQQSPPIPLHIVTSSHQDEIGGNDQPESQGFLKDELQSNSYESTQLETLRNDVTTLIPCMESIISQAIITTFSEEVHFSNGRATHIKYESCDDAINIEADTLWKTYRWLKSNHDKRQSNLFHKEKMDFMQEQMNHLVANVRYKLLSSPTASRIIHGIAEMLKLKLAIPGPKDTVVLMGMHSYVTSTHIMNSLKDFGNIKAIGVSRGQQGFGICRYCSASAVKRALDAFKKKTLMIQGVFPQVFEPCSPTLTNHYDVKVCDTDFASDTSVEITAHYQIDGDRVDEQESHRKYKRKSFSRSSSSISTSVSYIDDRASESHNTTFDSQRSPRGVDDFYRYSQGSLFNEGNLSAISVAEIDDGSRNFYTDANYSVTISTTSTEISTILIGR